MNNFLLRWEWYDFSCKFLKRKKPMTFHIGQDEKFIYNDDVSYEQNFDKWLRWTNREHRIYKMKEYTKEEGRKVFASIHKKIDEDT